ncbi:hypothetical protein BE15_44935 [Sorangium cellulosum]|uniref:GIY-YIG domain-containing protein n=1 Tax=Sorangium cellulosum TaxID=56 RepID=A0A150QW58_SORCE|nr:hypothetical protein BE15_44935 [Sorangium cellulosum]
MLGAAAGTGELALGLAQSLVLNAMTLGGYGAYQHGRAMWDGYQAAGVLGAINAVNPLYEIGRNGADTALAIDRGDYRAAGSAGVKAILLGAATVYGAGRGLGALAEESAAAAGAIRGGASASSFVYQLVDDLGQPVYYGISKHPVSRLGQHARKPEGPFRGMQVISEPLPLPQARALETSLIQQAHAEGRLIYNTAGSSISSTAPIATPTMVQATETMLSPRLYPR